MFFIIEHSISICVNNADREYVGIASIAEMIYLAFHEWRLWMRDEGFPFQI
jgi:hypothetical protein